MAHIIIDGVEIEANGRNVSITEDEVRISGRTPISLRDKNKVKIKIVGSRIGKLNVKKGTVIVEKDSKVESIICDSANVQVNGNVDGSVRSTNGFIQVDGNVQGSATSSQGVVSVGGVSIASSTSSSSASSPSIRFVGMGESVFRTGGGIDVQKVGKGGIGMSFSGIRNYAPFGVAEVRGGNVFVNNNKKR